MGYRYLNSDPNTLTLFRGDYSHVHQFSMTKVYKWSLVGPGIYLTNCRPIAQTYRTKGATLDDVATLFEGPAQHRNDAKEKAFLEFLVNRTHVLQQVSYTEARRRVFATPKCYKAAVAKHRPEFEALIEAGAIDIDYVTHHHMFGHRSLPGELPTLRVTLYKNRSPGYLSTFAFPVGLIDHNVVHTHRPIADAFFWELMWKRKIQVGVNCQLLPDYVRENTGRSTILVNNPTGTFSQHKEVLGKIRRAVEPYGVIGFEYNGGMATGGRSHRAFCLWDEDLVNRHRVSLER